MPVAVASIGVVGALIVAVINHHLSKRRESVARAAMAGAKFRGSVEASLADVPPADKHWSNEVLIAFPSMLQKLGIAVAEFKPFLPGETASSFESQWHALKAQEEKIPKALSAAELLYGGGSLVAKASKEEFHAVVKRLLSYAQQT
ncbi:hypothetical protein [Rhodanobacter sp. C05]|uniref:hypothetical protein n=1 Tax=Rhodanobacter sp. C05 TaxID=1945855 RepID=UPI000985B2DF|nr:hypothetical protein [Rhodanobacter sp. C05]OOG36809.1 hypothetical protein B0E51_17755 [Rhodanobacter sp. C05]